MMYFNKRRQSLTFIKTFFLRRNLINVCKIQLIYVLSNSQKSRSDVGKVIKDLHKDLP